MGHNFTGVSRLAHQSGSRARAASTRDVIVAGVLITLAVVLAQSLSQWIDFRFLAMRMRWLDSNHHKSLFGVISILAQVAAAAVVALRAAVSPERRTAWRLLAALIGGLAVVRTFVDYRAVVLLPEVAAIFLLLCWLSFRDPFPARLLVLVSLVMLVCSFALHSIGLAADAASTENWSAAYQMTGIAKHGLELAGWMLLATGVLAAVSERRVVLKHPTGSA